MKLEWKGPLEHNNNWPPKFYMPQGKSFMEPFFTLFTALFCIRSCLTPLTLLKIDKLKYFLCTPASSWCSIPYMMRQIFSCQIFSAKWQFEIILYLYSSLNWIPSHEAKKNDYFDTKLISTGISGDWYV